VTIWQAFIEQIGLAIRKVAGPILAFLAGRKAQREKERAKDDKARIEDLQRRLDAAREIDRASRDSFERDRVQREYAKPDPDRASD